VSNKQVTVLEAIVEDVATALFQKWGNALPEDQRTEEALTALSKNAKETTYFVIQMFMDKFNQEADALKSQD
jgi:hypothetical protein